MKRGHVNFRQILFKVVRFNLVFGSGFDLEYFDKDTRRIASKLTTKEAQRLSQAWASVRARLVRKGFV